METNIELLAPAGSAESLKAAVNAGADAVYMGSTRFGARAYADNPDEDSYLKAMDYAHLHGRKVYLTVNTLLKEKETEELYAYLKPFYENGIDAVIVQDYGALLLIREYFPDLPIHASTQMTVTGSRYASILKSMGVSRIIPARELSLAEIKKISDSVDIELECFIHGALCFCYSGQCLMSSLIGGRSGNRGRCAQPCRLPYSAGTMKDSCLLSMKDLETLTILPDILDAGVTSLKIEGRMKSPRYTAGVVSIYRRYLDLLKDKGRDGYRVSEADINALNELFDRGGYTQGYFTQHNGKDMMALAEKPEFRKTDQKYFSSLDTEYVNSDLKIPVCGNIYVHEGEPVSLTVYGPESGCKAAASGPVAQTARTQPLTSGQIIRQIKKTGGSLYTFDDINCDISGSCFLPVKDLNELRRQALKAYEEKSLDRYRRKCVSDSLLTETPALYQTQDTLSAGSSGIKERPAGFSINVSVEDEGMLDAVISSDAVKEIYLDSAGIDASRWKDAAERIHSAGKKCALMLPPIFRTEAEEYFDRFIRELKGSHFDELIVRSLEEPAYLRENGIDIPLVFDANIYAWNRTAAEGYRTLGASRLTFPAELNSRELADLGLENGELIIYGHLPVMVTAQCLRRTTGKCDKTSGTIFMKDRTGRSFPVKNVCRFCYNTIYNPMPLVLAGEEEAVMRLDPSVLRIMFTIESPDQIRDILSLCERAFIRGEKTEIPFRDYTRGHFNRGVE